MAAAFDVVQSPEEFSWENTMLFPWWPQQEGYCQSRAPGSQQTAAWLLALTVQLEGYRVNLIVALTTPPPFSQNMHTWVAEVG